MQPYANTYASPADILRPTILNPGGLCSIIFFLWEDVTAWPTINPLTGKIDASVILREGASFYTIEPTETDRHFKEELKRNAAGPYHDILVNCRLGGNTNNATLALGKYQHHRFGLLVKDRNGEQRLIGDSNSGAEINFDYTSGDFGENRSRNIRWTWQHPMPAPIYHSGGISLVPPSCESMYTFVASFRVGEPGAPMVEGDDTYTNALLANSNFLLFADNAFVHQNTTAPDEERYCSKTFSGTTITINGGVYTNEVISIYKAQ